MVAIMFVFMLAIPSNVAASEVEPAYLLSISPIPDSINSNLISLTKKNREIREKNELEKQRLILEEEAKEKAKWKEISVCNASSVKTYMDYRMITSKTSKQYQLIHNSGQISVQNDGLLVSEDGFIGVALGSYWGEVGTKYKFILSSGQELKVIKVDEKDDRDTYYGCVHKDDTSVIEFVIQSDSFLANYGTYSIDSIKSFSGQILSAFKYQE